MRKIAIFLVTMVLLGQLALAFEAGMKVLSQEEITQLSSLDLTRTYIDVNVEIEAQKAFHAASGFMPEEYETFKDLLRYRILLINELKKRKLEVPQVQ